MRTILLDRTTRDDRIIITYRIRFTFLLLVSVPRRVRTSNVRTGDLTRLSTIFPMDTEGAKVIWLNDLCRREFTVRRGDLITNDRNTAFLYHRRLDQYRYR